MYSTLATLQGSKKLPKCVPHARRGQFLGFSTQHSSTVGQILNLVTGHISPQYHVVYDELYSTVTTAAEQEMITHAFPPDLWNTLFLTGYEQDDILGALANENLLLPELAAEWFTPQEMV
jgi:hypothetical protein